MKIFDSICFCLLLQVNDLTPQVIKAAKIVLQNPANQAAVEHFDLLKKQWSENMEKLRSLVDEATDTVAFIKACGQYMSNKFHTISRTYRKSWPEILFKC